MKKLLFGFIVVLNFTSVWGQNLNTNNENLPQFDTCKTVSEKNQEACFYNQINQYLKSNFNLKDNFKTADFKTEIITVFSVDENGKISTLFIESAHPDLKDETKRVFESFPKITPATYQGKPVYAKYTLKFKIPFEDKQIAYKSDDDNEEIIPEIKDEFKEISYKKFDNPKYNTGLGIPFSHSVYSQFDDEINQIGHNNHTASKPYSYTEVQKYYDFEKNNQSLKKQAKSWTARKFWNEEMVAFKTKDYWFTVNPIFDLRLGKDTQSEIKYTFHNTRGIQAQGAIGHNIFFTTTIFESQGRFADYYNLHANSIRPSGGNPAIIPGIGISKDFKTNSYDFPSADAQLTFAANKFFAVNLGYGRNFIGDGYRSLLVGDATSPYTFVKLNTTFWKIKYTNTYTFLKDVRPEVTFDRTYATKYMSNHYLSWNVNKRLNVGLFEAVIWDNSNGRGFDASFFNPIIFYRSVEFSSSGRSGNAMVGLTSKYKISNKANIYGQFIIDEFALGDVKKQDGSWRNKHGVQIGAKYYHAFGIQNLLLQTEYNAVRPYTYSHSEPITNYAHNNQGIAHLWGSNFREFIGIARYFKGRWFAEGKIIYGIRGFDYNTATDSKNYGSDLYKDYDENRPTDYGVKVGHGNKTTCLMGDAQIGYVVNPVTNLKCFIQVIYRDFKPSVETATTFNSQTVWVSAGIRTDIFNFYTDF